MVNLEDVTTLAFIILMMGVMVGSPFFAIRYYLRLFDSVVFGD